jgi:hypothetical protein
LQRTPSGSRQWPINRPPSSDRSRKVSTVRCLRAAAAGWRSPARLPEHGERPAGSSHRQGWPPSLVLGHGQVISGPGRSRARLTPLSEADTRSGPLFLGGRRPGRPRRQRCWGWPQLHAQPRRGPPQVPADRSCRRAIVNPRPSASGRRAPNLEDRCSVSTLCRLPPRARLEPT